MATENGVPREILRIVVIGGVFGGARGLLRGEFTGAGFDRRVIRVRLVGQEAEREIG